MWDAGGYATSHRCASRDGRRARRRHGGPALLRRLRPAPLPDSARQCAGRTGPRIAAPLGCDDQTVLDALHAFNARGLAALQKGSSRPHRPPPQAFPGERAEQLRALLRRSPRAFGHPTSLWTLELAAEVSCAEGLTPTVVSGEAIRKTLRRLGIGWKRAKQWITSPVPESVRKKGSATA